MKSISVLGIYAADLVFFGEKIPITGETILGTNHMIGPGGKGSNQAVAIAKAGGNVNFISKIGNDQYGKMAKELYSESGVNIANLTISEEYSTGVAGIMVNKKTGENAINVVPGAAGKITKNDIDKASQTIKESGIFLTQLEAPLDVVEYAIEIASSNNIDVILNPAPATKIQDKIFPLINYFTPNETEAAFYAGHKVETKEDAARASSKLLEKGIKNVIVTLGEKGAYFANKKEDFFIPAFALGNKVIDTTGAGDGFVGGLAVALTEGKNMKDAIKFANALAGLSTTKFGTAQSMPKRLEIDNFNA
ncbi:MAG: Ribokinase [Alphaproteobacteria bacterium MarineAlpha5_Bin12]|nr:MAG: Ribokinase [Alphaproteobacteria bacterium MarineAlpha5_Bin12]